MDLRAYSMEKLIEMRRALDDQLNADHEAGSGDPDSLNELLQRRRAIDDEIAARHGADPRNTEHQLRDAARKWGYALSEMLTGILSPEERRAQHPRYQHPFDPNLDWSGVGPKPDWVLQWEASGHSVEELRIRR